MGTGRIETQASNHDVFAAFDPSEASSHRLKAQIVAEIHRLTTERKLTQARAGELMGISQPQVSRLFNGNYREYSVERLLSFLTDFGREVEIVSRPGGGDRGRVSFRPTST